MKLHFKLDGLTAYCKELNIKLHIVESEYTDDNFNLRTQYSLSDSMIKFDDMFELLYNFALDLGYIGIILE